LIGVTGQSLSVIGGIFERDGSKAIRIPFATIYYYNYYDTTKVEFVTISNLAGEYILEDMQNGAYIVKIVAPGFQPKRQLVLFSDVETLAKNNNNQVRAHIELKRENNLKIDAKIFMIKDLVESDEDTIEKIIDNLKQILKVEEKKTGRIVYRIWFGGNELPLNLYNELKKEKVTTGAKKYGDRSLSKSYIEYYDFYDDNKTFVDGIFNIVFNNKNRKEDFFPSKISETTNFLFLENKQK